MVWVWLKVWEKYGESMGKVWLIPRLLMGQNTIFAVIILKTQSCISLETSFEDDFKNEEKVWIVSNIGELPVILSVIQPGDFLLHLLTWRDLAHMKGN